MKLKKKRIYCWECDKETIHELVGTDRLFFVPMFRFYQCTCCGEIEQEVAD